MVKKMFGKLSNLIHIYKYNIYICSNHYSPIYFKFFFLLCLLNVLWNRVAEFHIMVRLLLLVRLLVINVFILHTWFANIEELRVIKQLLMFMVIFCECFIKELSQLDNHPMERFIRFSLDFDSDTGFRWIGLRLD